MDTPRQMVERLNAPSAHKEKLPRPHPHRRPYKHPMMSQNTRMHPTKAMWWGMTAESHRQMPQLARATYQGCLLTRNATRNGWSAPITPGRWSATGHSQAHDFAMLREPSGRSSFATQPRCSKATHRTDCCLKYESD